MNRSRRTNLADADGKQAIEERVRRRRGFTPRRGSEVVVRVVAYAGERHVSHFT